MPDTPLIPQINFLMLHVYLLEEIILLGFLILGKNGLIISDCVPCGFYPGPFLLLLPRDLILQGILGWTKRFIRYFSNAKNY